MDGGPLYDAMKNEGDKIRVTFKNVGAGLVIAAPTGIPGPPPNPVTAESTGFEIAGADQKWQTSKAVIAGNAVTVSSEAVIAPVAVRYAWADCPACSLYSRDGVPAFPFRTDDWKESHVPLSHFHCYSVRRHPGGHQREVRSHRQLPSVTFLVTAQDHRGDGDDGHTAAVAIVKTVDQMQLAWSIASRAHGQTSGQMRARARHETRQFPRAARESSEYLPACGNVAELLVGI